MVAPCGGLLPRADMPGLKPRAPAQRYFQGRSSPSLERKRAMQVLPLAGALVRQQYRSMGLSELSSESPEWPGMGQVGRCDTSRLCLVEIGREKVGDAPRGFAVAEGIVRPGHGLVGLVVVQQP